MNKFSTMLTALFGHAKGEHIKGDMALNDVQISVESDPSGRCSVRALLSLSDSIFVHSTSPGMLSR